MRKTTFTKEEYNELKKLISQKVVSDKNNQRKIRNKIRKKEFYFQDFSSKKGYDVTDLESLIKAGQITISETLKASTSIENRKISSTIVDMDNEEFLEEQFFDFDLLDNAVLDNTGVYCIKIKNKDCLPERYKRIINAQNHSIIYIGKAQGQSLRERLNQEIYHTSPGTFFRSIGAVIGYSPIPGHLKGKSNQKNYKFSKEDTNKITNWLLENTEFKIFQITEDFSIEKQLITKYCPILNIHHNPQRLRELEEDRKRCRIIASQ